MHVVADPRQAGKSTLVRQVTDELSLPVRYASADERCSEALTASNWRERGQEVDFVVKAQPRLTAIEVKSGRAPQTHPGTAAFSAAFKVKRTLLVVGDGSAVEEFLNRPVAEWLAH